MRSMTRRLAWAGPAGWVRAMNTAMSRTLDKALAELSELPEDQQATLVARIEDMIARA